jgi:hypothetical protein
VAGEKELFGNHAFGYNTVFPLQFTSEDSSFGPSLAKRRSLSLHRIHLAGAAIWILTAMVFSGSGDLGWQNKTLLVSAVALSSVAYWQGWTPSTLRQLISPASGPEKKEHNEPAPVPPPKPVSASSVHMSCRVTPDITGKSPNLLPTIFVIYVRNGRRTRSAVRWRNAQDH